MLLPPPPLTAAAGARREKNSAKVERMVQFTGSSKITGLPPYLTVQMMRFFFKRTPDGGQKAKILRKVGCCCTCSLHVAGLHLEP